MFGLTFAKKEKPKATVQETLSSLSNTKMSGVWDAKQVVFRQKLAKAMVKSFVSEFFRRQKNKAKIPQNFWPAKKLSQKLLELNYKKRTTPIVVIYSAKCAFKKNSQITEKLRKRK